MNFKTIKVILSVILLALIGLVIYWAAADNTNLPPLPGSRNFDQNGNLVRNNPGMKEDIWYLVYESAGQPAKSTELVFDDNSTCVVNDTEEACDPEALTQGTRVRVQGTDKDGVVTVETLTLPNSNSSSVSDMIRVTSPQANAVVGSPLTITGEAVGPWYFEASFPIRMLDANGRELGLAVAQAQGEWMTEDFVPFTAILNFSNPGTETGTLVLQKDNPSGLPENDAELRIPVTFANNERTVSLFYYNEDKDKDASGNVMCSKDGLVAVERKIPVTTTPIQDTLRLLIAGQLTAQEANSGLDTEFPLSGFELEGANLQDSHLTLEFNDPNNQTGGGSCRVGILWHQIEATALQFPEVQSVSFTPEELFQP